MLWFECCERSFRERRHYHLAIGFRVSRYKRLSSFVHCNASNYSLTGLRCAIPTGQCRSYSSMMYKLATSHSLVPSVVHGLCYNDGLNTDAVITTGGDYGAVLAPYDTSTVFVRMLVRRSYEHGPPSYTVCLAGWPCEVSRKLL